MIAQDVSTVMDESYIQGLELAKMILVLHKEYGNDIDYALSTLEEVIKNREAELEQRKANEG